jgi:putative restriction endonuclease
VEYWVANTDLQWFQYLATREPVDEVNFWSPSTTLPKRLPQGAPWIFKLANRNGGQIVGGAFFATFSAITPRFAWDAFGDLNGASDYPKFLRAISGYSEHLIDGDATPVGSAILLQPFFLPPELWIIPPTDWAPNLTRGKTYDSTVGQGALLWERIQLALVTMDAAQSRLVAEPPGGYGEAVLVLPRLGQGTFRVLVTDAYDRRCAVTGERTLPVLEAAHIKPFNLVQRHEVSNGLLLRSDLHTLFDRGYMTVTPKMKLRVSRRIREEFTNGRDYYNLDSHDVRLPLPPNPPPSREFLEWHADTVFKG